MKRKRLSAVLVCGLVVALLMGFAIPFASAAQVVFLNPFGDVDQPDEGTLAARPSGLDNKNVLMLWYGAANDANIYAVKAIETKLEGIYSGITFTEGNGTAATMLGNRTLYGAKAAGVYDEWADYDAVVIAVIDDNVGAYWISQHAKEIEARGTPVAVVANNLFATAVRNGALKNGFSSIQVVEVDGEEYSRAYSQTITGTGKTARQAFIEDNVLTATVVNSVASALTGASLAAGIPIAQVVAGDFTFTIPSNPGKANQLFLEKSLDDGFGDGLALLIPTPALVDSLLATVERDKDEVIGKLLGGGIITVEKVAINAAMAGVVPKAFPVVLAAMEAFAQDREKQSQYDYALRTGDTQLSVLLMVSGPLSEELGMRSDRSDLGGGPWGALTEANATIGRAVKLCFRNIGRNAREDLAYKGAFTRFSDHALIVCSETLPSLPNDGWPSHSDFIGIGNGDGKTNTVTLIGVNMTRVQGSAPTGGVTSGWSNNTVLSGARSALGAAAGTAAAGATADIASIVTYPSYMVHVLTASDIGPLSETNLPDDWSQVSGGYGLKTKEDVQKALVGAGTDPDAENTARNQKLVWPMVMGGDSQHARAFNGGASFNSSSFQTQLIGGSAISTPVNFKVEVGSASGEVDLSWEAPARGTADYYQVSKDDGITWIDVDETEYTFENLKRGQQYLFAVRAMNDGRSSAELALIDGAFDVVYTTRGAWASASLTLPTAVRINGAALATVRRNATIQLTVTVVPEDATPAIVWSSSNPAIAAVDENGLVTAKTTGTVVITAKTIDGALTSIITVRVIA